jgi:hypothetical protein
VIVMRIQFDRLPALVSDAIQASPRNPVIVRRVIVYAIVDESLSPTSPLGDAIDNFFRREDAERFIANVKRDDPRLASHLRVIERELEARRTQLTEQGSPTTREPPATRFVARR